MLASTTTGWPVECHSHALLQYTLAILPVDGGQQVQLAVGCTCTVPLQVESWKRAGLPEAAVLAAPATNGPAFPPTYAEAHGPKQPRWPVNRDAWDGQLYGPTPFGLAGLRLRALRGCNPPASAEF